MPWFLSHDSRDARVRQIVREELKRFIDQVDAIKQEPEASTKDALAISQRPIFEKFAAEYIKDCDLSWSDVYGNYINGDTHRMWGAWRAALGADVMKFGS